MKLDGATQTYVFHKGFRLDRKTATRLYGPGGSSLIRRRLCRRMTPGAAYRPITTFRMSPMIAAAANVIGMPALAISLTEK